MFCCLRLLPFFSALVCSTLCGSSLLASSGFAGLGALLRSCGLTQALGFQGGFSLLGLLFDLVKLIELACGGGQG
ncbi:hypothetical protein D3C77_416280 [compost metagenome]